MKYLFVLFNLCCGLVLLSQNTWSKYYNVTQDAETVDLLIPYRQGYLVGSNVFCSPLTVDGCTYLMYINKSGDILKDFTLSASTDTSLGLPLSNSIIVKNDSSLIAYMKLNYTPTLTVLDTSFQVKKIHKCFSSLYNLNAKSVFEYKENRYILFNTNHNKITNSQLKRIWAIELDSSFNQIKQFGLTNADTFGIIEIPHFEKLKDQSFAVAFTCYLIGQKLTEDHYVGVMRFDSTGKVLWSKIYGPPPFDDFSYTKTVVKQLDNTNIVFSGAHKHNESQIIDGAPNYIQCLSLSGDSLWRTYFNYKTCACGKRIFDFTKAVNGDIIGCGLGVSYWDPKSHFKGWVFCLSSEGKLKWERFYSYKDTIQDIAFRNIFCDKDGSIMLGSEAYDGVPKNSGLWIMRLDSMGCLTPDCSGTDLVTAVKEVKTGYKELREVFFSISPNPANDIVKIDYFSPQPDRKVSFNLFDINGSLLQVINADASIENYTMPVRNLTSGAYVINMTLNGNVVQTEKLIISK